jgi:glycosyltransferase involved in cell wall biosynthesis
MENQSKNSSSVLPTVLVITQRPPSVTGLGTAMRIGNWIESLSRNYSVTLLLITTDKTIKEDDLLKYYRDKCKKVSFVSCDANCNEYIILNGFFSKFFTPRLLKSWPGKITNEFSSFKVRKFDVVFVFRLRLFPIWKFLETNLGFIAKKKIIDFDDIESKAAFRDLKLKGISHLGYRDFDDIESKAAFRDLKLKGISHLGYRCYIRQISEIIKLFLVEIFALNYFDKVAVCSSIDQEYLSKFKRINKIKVVPNCVVVPSPQSEFIGEHDSRKIKILFMGALSYYPNDYGLNWLLENVMPLVKKSLAHDNYRIDLDVVGRTPPEWMYTVASKGVFNLFPNVPTVDSFYIKADIVVVPIFQGGGTRIKLLEAFSHKRAVVSTTIGAEGIDLLNGLHLLLADSAVDFADSIYRLAKDPLLRYQLSSHAFKLLCDKYSTESFFNYTNSCLEN